MEEFWILIPMVLFATNLMDRAESVKVKLELKTFEEIFGEGWWDKGEAADLKTPASTNFRQNVHHQIDRQNTQIGQIEPNSTDQNPPLTAADHFDNAKNGDEPNEIIKEMTLNEKRKIIDAFHTIKEQFKQKGKFPYKERSRIENEIAKHLKVNRQKIYKWKKEFGLSRKMSYENEEPKHFVEKFDQMKAELTRNGFKNSYKQEIGETVAKELGLSLTTINRWKQKLGQTTPNHKYAHSEQKELMKRYYEIKGKSPKISDKEIVKLLKIGTRTLYVWKKQFKQEQFHPNSVVGHSVEENAAANVQEIGNSNSGKI